MSTAISLPRHGTAHAIALVAAAGAFLALFGSRSYLLFHSLAEVFSISIAAGVFMFAWSSRSYHGTGRLVYLGTGLLFTALIDLFHTLTYRGMGILDPGSDFATQLWIAGRYVQVLTFLYYAFSIGRRRVPYRIFLAATAALSLFLIASILYGDFFPTCFVEGQGVTPFKRASEYAVCALFALALALLHRRRAALDPHVYGLLAASIALTIVSELSFTLYVSVTGLANLVGHLLKIAAFFLVYLALVAWQVRKSTETIRRLEEAQAALVASEADLREANASKDRLYSIIAHDMRNPISGLQTMSDLLVRRYDELGDGERRRFCRILHEGAGQAAALMESLLQWARSQTGRLVATPMDLTLQEAVLESVGVVQHAADQKAIAISVSVPRHLMVHADPAMTETVVRNLLSNAVKFTPRGGTIGVTAGECGSEVHVAVSDSGVGIPAEHLEGLFRLGAVTSTKGTEAEQGSALGLLLSRELVEKNGGRIWAESEPGRGSTFHFTLPRSALQPG